MGNYRKPKPLTDNRKKKQENTNPKPHLSNLKEE